MKVGDPKLDDSQFIGAGGEFKFKLSNSFGTQLRSLIFATDIFGFGAVGIDMDGFNKTGLLCDA